jgi:hypothetical protein
MRAAALLLAVLYGSAWAADGKATTVYSQLLDDKRD